MVLIQVRITMLSGDVFTELTFTEFPSVQDVLDRLPPPATGLRHQLLYDGTAVTVDSVPPWHDTSFVELQLLKLSRTFAFVEDSDDSSPLFIIKLLGSGAPGKSSLIRRFTTGEWQDTYMTIRDFQRNQQKRHVLVDGSRKMRIQMWELAGREAYGRSVFVHLCKTTTHAVLVLFDVTDTVSFDFAKTRFLEAQQKTEPGMPFVLVGNKIDLESTRQVSREEAEAFANFEGLAYFETSARENIGVEAPFHALFSALVDKYPEESTEARKAAVCSFLTCDAVEIKKANRSSSACFF